MLKFLRNLLDETITAEDFRVAMSVRNRRHPHRPFFPLGKCPFAAHVLKNGTVARQFASTRHDN